MIESRWGRCIYHRGEDTETFLRSYLADEHRRVLLIAGAGFDPRSTVFSRYIARYTNGRTRAFFLREERPNPNSELVTRANRNEKELRDLIAHCDVSKIDVFAPDNAVIGGRMAVGLINQVSLNDITDIFVDFSALSIGVAYPIARYLLSKAEQRGLNLHLVVNDAPGTDNAIQSTVTDVADTIHGFRGGWGLEANNQAAILWMPQLALGKKAVLERIRQRVQPHAFCPILPFPAEHPRLPDQLIEHYAEEFENTWQVDSRDIVYASQSNPLDLYRTILRMDDSRKRVFAEIGGSQIVLSPVGSKALAIGALMSALERNFTIMYVETISYTVDFTRIEDAGGDQTSELVHIWLTGEAYSPSISEETSN